MNAPLRICMVCASDFPAREGLGFFVANLSRYLQTQGHSVTVVTRGSAAPTERRSLGGLEVVRVPFLPIYPLHLELHGIFLRRVLARHQSEFDLFHVHSPVVPRFQTRRPVVATFHSALRHDVARTPLIDLHSLLVKLQGPFSYVHEQALLRQAGAVTAVSTMVAGALQKYPVDFAPCRVIPNAVWPDEFQRRPGPFEPPARPCFLTVGRLVPGKGLEDLLQVAGEMPEANFQIAGEGPLRASLQRTSAGLPNVEWLGHISERNSLAELYRRATAMVMLSHYEGLPTVVLEAMASGCPVVATRVGGIPELIEDGVTGRLVDSGEPGRLLQALKQLSKAELRHWSECARLKVESQFSWAAVGARFETLYRSLL